MRFLLTWTRLSTAEAPQAPSEADHWDRTVTNVKKLPKSWKAQWLIKNDTSENRPFTKPLLDKMDAKQAGAVEKVFNVVLCIVDATPVTPTMREDKKISSDVFTWRLMVMQNPLKGWCATYVSESGEINWALACPYQLQWPESDPANAAGPTSATGMLFVGGCYQALNVSIDTSFQLIDPWDVFKARLHKEGNPPINYFMSQFFPVGHGPNSSLISKKGSEL